MIYHQKCKMMLSPTLQHPDTEPWSSARHQWAALPGAEGQSILHQIWMDTDKVRKVNIPNIIYAK